jgi:hypothetical protein
MLHTVHPFDQTLLCPEDLGYPWFRSNGRPQGGQLPSEEAPLQGEAVSTRLNNTFPVEGDYL